MTEHHLSIVRTARYYLQGEPSTRTHRLWVVCHGYGQLAAYFLRHFAFLAEADPGTVVVAPEGLSRFYLQGNGGRVGASWMTRDDRLSEINDHVAFLNQVVNGILSQCAPDVAVTVLGFSQGTATVSRWLAQVAFRPAQLILWAGGFPDDLPPALARRLLAGLPLALVVGTDDEFITPAQATEQLEQLRQLGAAPEFISFPGPHALNRAVLARLAGFASNETTA